MTDRQSTHGHDCWGWGPKHYDCAVMEIERLAARLTTETSNAWGEWPARYACNGPEGTFWTDDAALANKLIAAAFDRDEWTVTDTQNPTAAAPPPAAPQPPSAPVGVEGRYHPCTHILIDGLKRLEGGAAVLAEWDRVRALVDAALAPPQGDK